VPDKYLAQVTHFGFLDCQVCVPETFTDEQVLAFASEANPCGTEAGWQISREGSKYLAGSPERARCDGLAGFVHLMLDA
jgi:hypothetical protein